jgi:hypothetical protein
VERGGGGSVSMVSQWGIKICIIFENSLLFGYDKSYSKRTIGKNTDPYNILFGCYIQNKYKIPKLKVRTFNVIEKYYPPSIEKSWK